MLSSTTRKQVERGGRGRAPAPPSPPTAPPPNPRRPASASLRTISVDDSEHLLHNHRVSVASLRLLFTFAPERRSACLRNERSPSPEYPAKRRTRSTASIQAICPSDGNQQRKSAKRKESAKMPRGGPRAGSGGKRAGAGRKPGVVR